MQLIFIILKLFLIATIGFWLIIVISILDYLNKDDYSNESLKDLRAFADWMFRI